MSTFTTNGTVNSHFLRWFSSGLENVFQANGYEYLEEPTDQIRLVFHFIDRDRPRPFRRKAQATFVVSVLESDEKPNDIFKAAYPYLIRSLANHLIYIVHDRSKSDIYFITPEQGRYRLTYWGDDEQTFFQTVYQKLKPLASSRLVIDNEFHEDLPETLWNGNEQTDMMQNAGKKLDRMNLLPAPFPIEELLNDRDMKHLKKLYGIGLV